MGETSEDIVESTLDTDSESEESRETEKSDNWDTEVITDSSSEHRSDDVGVWKHRRFIRFAVIFYRSDRRTARGRSGNDLQ
ncbi:hypothetical protein EA462_01325 [Natrarchaeobius halalkaliphilus]|uniref:Uncharacterized protein n=1 Tax=Natrarchaeobius halalkaliphilus TaxID=1679091 RepID=A0A3N6M9C9_9EURY|nr:hypothetical protein EA462_01325 [Natrarchaeobius halalkaliphilus]